MGLFLRIFFTCLNVLKWGKGLGGERSEPGERWQVEPSISTGFMPQAARRG